MLHDFEVHVVPLSMLTVFRCTGYCSPAGQLEAEGSSESRTRSGFQLCSGGRHEVVETSCIDYRNVAFLKQPELVLADSLVSAGAVCGLRPGCMASPSLLQWGLSGQAYTAQLSIFLSPPVPARVCTSLVTRIFEAQWSKGPLTRAVGCCIPLTIITIICV